MVLMDIDLSEPQHKWRKVAHGGMQPGFEDNHTDESFLEDMVMNANVVKRDMLKVMLDSVSISQYLCIVALVVLVWTYTLTSTLDENSLLLLDIGLLGSGFSVLLVTREVLSLHLLFHYFLNISFFTTWLYVLAPVYKTLTRSISSDSIWAVTISLIILHLFLHDYSGSTIRPPRGSQKSNSDQLHLLKRVGCGFCLCCFSPSIKIACIWYHVVLVASVSVCSIRELLCQEILLVHAPTAFVRIYGGELGFGLHNASIDFHYVAGFVGFCHCSVPLLAYKNSGVQV